MRKHLAGFCMVLAASACLSCAAVAGPAVAQDPNRDAATVASAKPAILAANREWLPAMRAHDVDRIVQPYAEDALFVTPDGSAIRGREAIARFYKARLADHVRIGAGNLGEDGIAAAGDLVYEWGHAAYSIARGAGKPVESGGQYLTVWKRDSSGTWQIIRNLSF